MNANQYSKDRLEYLVDACIIANIVHGIAEHLNWDSESRGGVTSIDLGWMQGDLEHVEMHIDTDEDMYCDNVDLDTDMNGSITQTRFCASDI